MITSDEKINLTYTILEDMLEPMRTELPPKTFVEFRLSPFEYSAMEKLARFLNSQGLIPVSSLARVCLFSHVNTVARALEQEQRNQERSKQQSQPSTPFTSRTLPWSST